MGGVKTIDMRAHGTQKTKTKAMCSHKTKPQAHGQQNKSPAMCKTRHEHAANENTHKPHVHTRHYNMKARSQWKTRAACHTAQDITWMHAVDKNTNCVQHHTHTTHVDKRARTMRQNMERECPNPDTKPKLKTWVPGSEHNAPTPNKAHRQESAQLEHTRNRVLTRKQDKKGVRALSQNHE